MSRLSEPAWKADKNWVDETRRYGCLIALTALTGCSVNGVGTVSQNRTEGDGAWVLSREAPGIHLELTGRQAALVIGHFKAQYVFPKGCTDTRRPPQLSVARSYGFQMAASGDGLSATLGYRETAIFLSVDHNSDYGRSIDFQPNQPQQTILRYEYVPDC